MVTIFMVNKDIARGMVCFFHQKKHSYLIYIFWTVIWSWLSGHFRVCKVAWYLMRAFDACRYVIVSWALPSGTSSYTYDLTMTSYWNLSQGFRHLVLVRASMLYLEMHRGRVCACRNRSCPILRVCSIESRDFNGLPRHVFVNCDLYYI
jgi:hypothetical protein